MDDVRPVQDRQQRLGSARGPLANKHVSFGRSNSNFGINQNNNCAKPTVVRMNSQRGSMGNLNRDTLE